MPNTSPKSSLTMGDAAPGGRPAEASRILLRSLVQITSRSDRERENSYLTSTEISETPAEETEVTLSTSGNCWIAVSRLSVTSAATCSGAAPG